MSLQGSMERLLYLDAENMCLKVEIARLRDALQDLCDQQNGPPLERNREDWQRAYDRARELLRAY